MVIVKFPHVTKPVLDLTHHIKCPERNTLSTVFTGIYMFVSNLILLNILIAIFTDTYKNVNTNIRKVWTNGRYDVILEDYHYMPFGPILGGLIQFYLILWFVGCCLIRLPSYISLSCHCLYNGIKRPVFLNKVRQSISRLELDVR